MHSTPTTSPHGTLTRRELLLASAAGAAALTLGGLPRKVGIGVKSV